MVEQVHSNYVHNNIRKGIFSASPKVSENSIWDGRININGVIEPTRQSKELGNCWLLTDLNAISSTSWGKYMIKQVIEANSNGVSITFWGAKDENGYPIRIDISAQEIINARESGKYSQGDDDVTAFELAFEKYLKSHENEFNIKTKIYDAKFTTEDGLNGGNGYSLEFVTQLLFNKSNVHNFRAGSHDDAGERKFMNELDAVFEEIAKDPNEYAVTVGFIWDWMDMYAKHAYQVKEVITDNDGKKWVILINPWDSSKEEKVSYELFKCNVDGLKVAERPFAETNSNLKSQLEKEHDSYNKKREFLSTILPKISEELLKYQDGSGDVNMLIELMHSVDKDTVEYLIRDKEQISFYIEFFDSIAHGLRNKKNKKALISPIINAMCDLARKNGVNEKLISNCQNACNKELKSLYTNEKIIIEKLVTLRQEIDNKRNMKNFFKFTFLEINS